jgi:Flp pilus assembly protein TadG
MSAAGEKRVGKRRMRVRHLRGSSGSAAVELAIVSPLVFLLTLAAFELGRGIWVKHTLSHAASEATRYASLRSVTSDDPATASSITSRVKSAVSFVNLSDLTVQTAWTPANTVGSTVQVRVSYDFHPVTPLLPFKTLQLASTSIVTVAY